MSRKRWKGRQKAMGMKVQVRSLPDPELKGDPQMLANTNSWLSQIWGVKEVQALATMARAVICGCGNHKELQDLSDFYEISPPNQKEARAVYDYFKGGER